MVAMAGGGVSALTNLNLDQVLQMADGLNPAEAASLVLPLVEAAGCGLDAAQIPCVLDRRRSNHRRWVACLASCREGEAVWDPLRDPRRDRSRPPCCRARLHAVAMLVLRVLMQSRVDHAVVGWDADSEVEVSVPYRAWEPALRRLGEVLAETDYRVVVDRGNSKGGGNVAIKVERARVIAVDWMVDLLPIEHVASERLELPLRLRRPLPGADGWPSPPVAGWWDWAFATAMRWLRWVPNPEPVPVASAAWVTLVRGPRGGPAVRRRLVEVDTFGGERTYVAIGADFSPEDEAAILAALRVSSTAA